MTNKSGFQQPGKNTLDSKEKVSFQEAMEISTLVQKLGKSKRKHIIALKSYNKKLIRSLAKEMKKGLGANSDASTKNFNSFLSYLEDEAKSKKELKLSFDEILFLKKLIQLSLKQMESSTFKWYQVFQKFFIKILMNQYKLLLKNLNV